MKYCRNTRLAYSVSARVLTFVLAISPTLAEAQAPASQQPAEPGQPAPAASQPLQPIAPLPLTQGLKIVPLAGKGEMNDLERRVMAPLVVQVVDQNERPVQGAEVIFRFPVNAPGATFAGGKTSLTSRTNGEGQAAAMNWTANGVGTFDVHVTATYGNQVGETTFSMTNVTRIVEDLTKKDKRTSWWSNKWAKVAVIGGVAAIAVGIVLATRGGGTNSTPSSTVTISAGSPTIGGSR